MTAALDHIVEIFLLLLLRSPAIPGRNQFGKADNMIERRSQLVAHIGQEFALGAIRNLGSLSGGLQLCHFLLFGDVLNVEDEIKRFSGDVAKQGAVHQPENYLAAAMAERLSAA